MQVYGNAARRALLGSFFGTALESYDFVLFGSAAGLIFGRLFFPGSDPVASTLLAYGAFAVGFVARPLGGIMFGNYGDRLGRKPMLLITLSLMGAVTVAIGLLPTYEQIGVAAPILLTALRFLQGIAYGGEWGGAVVLVVEYAPPARRGFFGACPNGGASLGTVLALGLMSVTSFATGPAFFTWGWRIPFLFSLVLIGIGVYVRTRIVETPEFLALKQAGRQHKQPMLDAIREHYREILLTAGTLLLINAGFYVTAVFVLTYGGLTLGLGMGTMLNAVMVATAVQIFASIGFGALSDRVGRIPVLTAATIFVALYIFPLFWLLQTKDPVVVTAALTVSAIAFGALYGPIAALFAEAFDTSIRYSGASLGYQIGAVFGGGLAPLIATGLLQHYGATWPICVYMIVLSVVALSCLSLLGETSDRRAVALGD
jgi:MFS transporter, MHS family, shikimate and dehydroshikimate transport protein